MRAEGAKNGEAQSKTKIPTTALAQWISMHCTAIKERQPENVQDLQEYATRKDKKGNKNALI